MSKEIKEEFVGMYVHYFLSDRFVFVRTNEYMETSFTAGTINFRCPLQYESYNVASSSSVQIGEPQGSTEFHLNEQHKNGNNVDCCLIAVHPLN